MDPRFEIQFVSEEPKRAFVIGKKVEGPNFHVGPGAALEGAAVVPWDERIQTPAEDATIFAFALEDSEDLQRFAIGQVVTLLGATS